MWTWSQAGEIALYAILAVIVILFLLTFLTVLSGIFIPRIDGTRKSAAQKDDAEKTGD